MDLVTLDESVSYCKEQKVHWYTTSNHLPCKPHKFINKSAQNMTVPKIYPTTPTESYSSVSTYAESENGARNEISDNTADFLKRTPPDRSKELKIWP
ncbi:hypothetical protein IMY05_011G0034000 [Salix suchowensis]|nr:hypothetical protein IMY05_011G0034000 [Salix suchowensis]